MPTGTKMTLTVVAERNNFQIVTFMTLEEIRNQIHEEAIVWSTFRGVNDMDEEAMVEIERERIVGFVFMPWHPPVPQATPLPPGFAQQLRGRQ